MKRVNNLSIIREANLYLVLNTIMAYGPITIEDIVYKTRLSRPTILSVLKDITDDNVVHKSGLEKSGGGRQAALYSVNEKAYYAIGVDISYPYARLCVSDLAGNPIYSSTDTFEWNTPAESVLVLIIKLIVKAVSDTAIPVEKFIGIGLGVPGIVDITNNISNVLKRSSLPGWDDLDVNGLIFAKTGIHAYLRNNFDLVGYAESKLPECPFTDMLYIGVNVNIGMAIIRNGKIYDGCFGNAGYIGHTCIDMNGEKCYCGRTGCAEMYGSTVGMCGRYKAAAGLSDDTPLDLAKLLALAGEGDTAAKKVVSQGAKAIGIAIANAILHYDIPYVILGGLPCDEASPFFASIRSTVLENTGSVPKAPVKLRLGRLDEELSAIGGCHYTIDKFFLKPRLVLSV